MFLFLSLFKSLKIHRKNKSITTIFMWKTQINGILFSTRIIFLFFSFTFSFFYWISLFFRKFFFSSLCNSYIFSVYFRIFSFFRLFSSVHLIPQRPLEHAPVFYSWYKKSMWFKPGNYVQEWIIQIIKILTKWQFSFDVEKNVFWTYSSRQQTKESKNNQPVSFTFNETWR